MQNKKIGIQMCLHIYEYLSLSFYRAKPASQIVAKQKSDYMDCFQWFTTEKGRFTTSLFSMKFYLPK